MEDEKCVCMYACACVCEHINKRVYVCEHKYASVCARENMCLKTTQRKNTKRNNRVDFHIAFRIRESGCSKQLRREEVVTRIHGCTNRPPKGT